MNKNLNINQHIFFLVQHFVCSALISNLVFNSTVFILKKKYYKNIIMVKITRHG